MKDLRLHMSPIHFLYVFITGFSCLFFSTAVASKRTTSLRFAFYNTENFFDYFNDSLKADDDFTPIGIKGWKKTRYETKYRRIYQSIAALNEKPLAFLGLCEVENSRVLTDLCFGTPLKHLNFRFIHYESEDRRGIDVAFLYNADLFTPSLSYPIKIRNEDSLYKTRDILYIKGILTSQKAASDSIHIFICHFPSKYGGSSSDSKRFFAGLCLKKQVDSLFSKNPKARIIVMGDFNDEPSAACLKNSLRYRCKDQAKTPNDSENILINIMCQFEGVCGSHKFRGRWSIIDQFLLSPALLKEMEAVRIFDQAFLLTEDKNYGGKMPFRSFWGAKYQGGFSDHLPIYVDMGL